jgi:D-alanyl-D-alanine carboxypeptidase/D-alanyl-D-alanine-endopeptidase (penicillin-binding protein 4)
MRETKLNEFIICSPTGSRPETRRQAIRSGFSVILVSGKINAMNRKLLSSFVLLVAAASLAASQTPTPTPSPVPQSSPMIVQKPPQTLADLQSAIRARLQRPELRRGQVGIKIVSLTSGKIIFEENAEKYFMPASNMKNFTVATALEKLTPDFRFVTSVYAPSAPDSAGVIKGNLRIFGRGDISISTSFSDGNYYKGLDDLADKIVATGVKRVEGDLIADETYFVGNPVPGEWEWDDLQWYYGAEISALPLNDNAIDLSVTPGPVGYPCSVRVSPFNPIFRVTNQCLTSAAGTLRTLKIEKKVDRNILEITGALPAGNSGFSGSVTVSRPAELFVALLKERLALKGVTITGQTRAVKLKPVGTPEASVEIAKLESPPLSVIAAKTMKPSQNMYTETLLWTLGENARAAVTIPGGGVAPVSTANSADLGLSAVSRFLNEIGVAPDGIIQHDGSGLSRHNLITPAAVVQLYSYMGRQSKFSQAWRDSLTIGGVDGTLRNRFSGTRAAGNVRGKTGTIDQVSALSGYVKTAAGEELVFSMVVNGVNETRMRTSAMDEIVVNLANFDGRID